MALPDQPAERHRQVAGLFTDRVHATKSWEVRDEPGAPRGRGGQEIVAHAEPVKQSRAVRRRALAHLLQHGRVLARPDRRQVK